MGSLRKVQPGDPLVIPAGAFNTFVDAARDFLHRRHQRAQAGTPAKAGLSALASAVNSSLSSAMAAVWPPNPPTERP